MARLYVTSTTSDLSGGADFNRVLSDVKGTSGTLSVSVAGNATETSYAFTEAGKPGTKGVSTGTFSLSINVTSGNTSHNLSISLSRINSSGTVQATSSATAEQSMSTGVKTFTITNPSLGTWASGDRFRVNFVIRNSAAAARSATYSFGDDNSFIDVPFIENASFSLTESTDTASITAFAGYDANTSFALTENADSSLIAVSSPYSIGLSGVISGSPISASVISGNKISDPSVGNNISLSATEAADQASFAASLTSSIALSATEPTDSLSAAITAVTVASLSASETADALAFAVSISSSASLAATEDQDSAAFSLGAALSVSLVATEPPDVASFALSYPAEFTLSATEPSDTAVLALYEFISVALSVTEATDTASIAATATTNANLAANDNQDAASFTVSAQTDLSFSVSEAADSASIAATVFTTISFAATESSDAASLSVSISTAASFAVVENTDSASFNLGRVVANQDPWTAAWAEAQASVPANIIELFTIELLHPSFIDENGDPVAVRAVRDTQDHVLTLESTASLNAGEDVTFTAIPFDVPWPEINEGQVPELLIRVDNIGREIVPYLDAAVQVQAPVTVVFRVYLYDTVAGTKVSGIDPITFPLRSVTVTETYVEGSASPSDLANLRAMRLVYDLANYPGLDVAA